MRGRLAFYTMLIVLLVAFAAFGGWLVLVGGWGFPLAAGSIVHAESGVRLEQMMAMVLGVVFLTVFLPVALLVFAKFALVNHGARY